MTVIKKVIHTVLIIFALILLFTRVSNTQFISTVAQDVEETLISDYKLNGIAQISLVRPYLEAYLENELEIKDRFLIKIIEINGLVKGEYVAIMGHIINTRRPQFNIEPFEQLFSESSEKSQIEYKYLIDEIYTNIPYDDHKSDYKILKIQLALTYTDENLKSTIEENMDLICDHVCGYFCETTLEMVNRDGGKEIVKDDLLEGISELLNTDVITHIYLPVLNTQ